MTGIIAGFFGGISAILFVHLIRLGQSIREAQALWIFSLPFAGLLIRTLYHRFGKGVSEAPTLAISVFLSHLGGASTGREGAIIHFSRILSNATGHFLNFPERQIKKLMVASIGAGFGAALGAPFAGLIFGFEENNHPFLRAKTLIHSAVATIIAQALVHFARIEHFRLPSFTIPDYEFNQFVFLPVLGVLFGLIAVLYLALKKTYESFFQNTHPALAGFIGGGILFSLYCIFEMKDFQGLGESTILHASQTGVSAWMTMKKILVTAISLGSGFQGGEFFPLAFFGATLGSAFAFVNPVSIPLFAATGVVSVYGASTRTPIACTILAAEMFGFKILPYAVITIFIANLVSSRITLKSSLDS
jgi:H+/Cl- antiporter ClcA